MLEFNQEHKVADLSAIKLKTEKARKTGKVIICGIALSSVLLLSGCGNSNVVANEQPSIEQPVITSSAKKIYCGSRLISLVFI